MEWRLFAQVPEDELRRVLAIARRRTFERGEVVFHRGDPADSLQLISKGRFATRITTPLADTATLGVLGPGEAFGELALVSEGAVRSATVSALEPAETHPVYRTDFARLMVEHPGVREVLIGLLAEQVRRSSERLIEALYVPAEQRVLRRLTEMAEQYGAGPATSSSP